MMTKRRATTMTATLAVLAISAAASYARLGHGPPALTAGTARAAKIWKPAPRTTWQWQLTTPVDQSVPAKLFDIDLFDNSASVVASLHRRGHKVICYLDAGTYDDFRSDAGAFPGSVLGNTNGWPGERWLDIRRLSVL